MTSLLSVASSAPSRRVVPLDAEPNRLVDDALDVADIAGLRLFDWQAEVLRDACMVQGANPDRWAAREVGVVVSRQAGKGSILEVRQLAGLFVWGERLQVHSAHEFRTCYEHFRRIVGLIENCDLLLKQVKIIRTGAGDQAIELKSGARLRFIARSRASGRGFSADAIYLDEAFELSVETMGALLPALSARPNPQVWYTSSAAHKTSTVLHSVRRRGLAGDDPRLFYVEWSNEPDVDPLDTESWRRANPSLGLLVSEEDIAAEQRSLDPAEFARERLGIAEEPEDTEATQLLPNWPELANGDSVIVESQQWALSVSPDRLWASIGKAGRTSEGKLHVEWMDHRAGTGWIVDRVVEYWASRAIPIRVHKSGPEAAFIAPLRERGVEVVEVSSADVAQATGQLLDAAANGQLVHLGQPSLTKAVHGAVLSMSSDGASVLSQRKSSVEITPLLACTVALGGVSLPGETVSEFVSLVFGG